MNHNNDLDGNWQQPPAISGGMPFTLQMLSTGAGVGIGCGVGIGFISPINLSTVPVLGQAAQGISSSLAGLGSIFGPVGASTRAAARSLGVPGLDVGAGCGVLAGYFFGAGLMVKPSVVEGVGRATAQLAGRLTGMLQQHQPQRQPESGPLAPQHSSIQQQQQEAHTAAAANTAVFPNSSTTGIAGQASSPVSQFQGMVPSEQQPQQQQQQTPTAAAPAVGRHVSNIQQQGTFQGVAQVAADPVVTRLLLQQQADIAVLRQQNRQLRDAVCRIIPKAVVCKGWKDRGSKRMKGAHAEGGDGGAAGDVWSD